MITILLSSNGFIKFLEKHFQPKFKTIAAANRQILKKN